MSEIKIGDWRWMRPDPSDPNYLGKDWVPAIVIEIDLLKDRAVVEREGGSKGWLDIDRVSELCKASEFLDSTWRAMNRRTKQVRSIGVKP